jgi:hypothetical protein
MKINWREVCKFLSGAFFVTAGASWYFAWYQMAVPFMGGSMSPEFLRIRGAMHFCLFLITFYIGFIKKKDASK